MEQKENFEGRESMEKTWTALGTQGMTAAACPVCLCLCMEDLVEKMLQGKLRTSCVNSEALA